MTATSFKGEKGAGLTEGNLMRITTVPRLPLTVAADVGTIVIAFRKLFCAK